MFWKKKKTVPTFAELLMNYRNSCEMLKKLQDELDGNYKEFLQSTLGIKIGKRYKITKLADPDDIYEDEYMGEYEISDIYNKEPVKVDANGNLLDLTVVVHAVQYVIWGKPIIEKLELTFNPETLERKDTIYNFEEIV